MNLNFPYQFDGRGRTAQAPLDDWIKGLVEQALFTSPGERVNMPDFGSGLQQTPFAPNGGQLAAALQFSVMGSLQKWLSGQATVQAVDVEAQDSTLTVTVRYTAGGSDTQQVQTYVYGGTNGL